MNKEDKQGYIVIIVLLTITGLIVWLMINYTTQQEKSYEYALKQEIGVSSECWLDDGIAKCIVDKEIIKVDNYYEIESSKQ